jgi:hypothetical protein
MFAICCATFSRRPPTVLASAHGSASGDEGVDEVRADESRRPGDEDSVAVQVRYGQLILSLRP